MCYEIIVKQDEYICIWFQKIILTEIYCSHVVIIVLITLWFILNFHMWRSHCEFVHMQLEHYKPSLNNYNTLCLGYRLQIQKNYFLVILNFGRSYGAKERIFQCSTIS